MGKVAMFLPIKISAIPTRNGTINNDIKRTLSGAKKENVDQFLVKKKNPLILPPNFDDLPKPQKETKKNNIENKSIDFSEVLKKSENVSKNAKKKDQSLEKSISKILSSN